MSKSRGLIDKKGVAEQEKQTRDCQGCRYKAYLDAYYPHCTYLLITGERRKAKVRRNGGCKRYVRGDE